MARSGCSDSTRLASPAASATEATAAIALMGFFKFHLVRRQAALQHEQAAPRLVGLHAVGSLAVPHEQVEPPQHQLVDAVLDERQLRSGQLASQDRLELEQELHCLAGLQTLNGA